MKQSILLSSLCVGLLCGCANVKTADYQRPDAPAKPTWSRPAEAAVSAARTDTFLGEISMAGLREWAVESEHGLLVFAETTRPH